MKLSSKVIRDEFVNTSLYSILKSEVERTKRLSDMHLRSVLLRKQLNKSVGIMLMAIFDVDIANVSFCVGYRIYWHDDQLRSEFIIESDFDLIFELSGFVYPDKRLHITHNTTQYSSVLDLIDPDDHTEIFESIKNFFDEVSLEIV